jgi:4-amino-4-deoxy-L-arabinose transferase-like glycosyltransferase
MPTAEPTTRTRRAPRERGRFAGGRAAGAQPAGRCEPLAPTGEPALSRGWAWAGLAVVLALALALRLWGVAEGLPYVYDLDEAAHFVPRAIAMSGLHLNPHYFANPPALTYLLHVVFAARFGGYAGVAREAALNPGEVYLVARITVAALGVLAVWLLYVLGASLFGRAVALLAAALEAVAFLPVFYAHLALNDVPTLVPLTASLIGSVGIVKRGRARDYLLAGVALGLAAATKYTAGVAVLPLLAAVIISHRQARADGSRRALPALAGLLLAGASALLAFLVANPYALLDFHSFTHELAHESAVAEEAGGKLGSPHELGVLYYLWSFTWGLGFIPALAALGGLVMVWFRDRRISWLLTPMVLAYLVFMGTEDRYFGRWLMPLLPLACLLAAFFAFTLAFALARRLARARPAGGGRRALAFALCGVLAGALLLAQGALYSVHTDTVLARTDTRGLMRAWMLAHVPAAAAIVLEPVVPQAWLHEAPALGPRATRYSPRSAHQRWSEYPLLLKQLEPVGSPAAGRWQVVRHYLRVEDYEHTLTPALLDYYEQQGYCWVVTSSIQSGRAYADPGEAPAALAYYAALARRAHLVHLVSPYTAGSAPVGFSFDWSFDYYPLSYRLPGPEMRAYRLDGARCASGA